MMVLQALRRPVARALLGGALLLVASLACTSGGGEDEGADGPLSWRTLQHVIDRDELWCGVKKTQPLFGYQEANGSVVGFDIDFCKAIAAAVLGDATKVEYVDASAATTRFDLLRDGTIDVLIRTTTVTASRDRELGIDFAQPIFYSGYGSLVRKDSGIDTMSDFTGAGICPWTLRILEGLIVDPRPVPGWVVDRSGFPWDPKGGLASDVVDAFFAGRCDVLTGDVSDLASLMAVRDADADYKILRCRPSRRSRSRLQFATTTASGRTSSTGSSTA